MSSHRPKILHVFKTAPPISFGGVEDVINNIASTTNNHYEHTVLCTNKDKSFISIESNYKLISFKYSVIFSNNPIALGFHRYLLQHGSKYDLIHFHFPYPMMDFHYSIKTPYIITYHADLLRSKLIIQPYRLLAKQFLKRAECVVYTSKKYVKYSTFSQYASKIRVIPLTASELAESYLAEQLSDKDYFIYIGNFRKYKDLPTLVLASIEADVNLILLGDGLKSSELKKLVEKNNFSKVRFYSNVSDLEKFKLLSKARALILPSNSESEAFGVVLLEAATLGKPIVTANLNSGTTEVNEDNVTGFIFEKSKVEHLAEILRKLNTDDELCAELGSSNRTKYKTNFTRKLFGQRYLNLYTSIIKK